MDLIVTPTSTPEELGYRDKITLLDENKMGFHCPMSACPNPYKVIHAGQSDLNGSISTIEKHIPWRSVYGWVACNTEATPYFWECWTSPKHGKCLMINGLGPVPTRFPDMSNGGMMHSLDVEMHPGVDGQWRGSAACFTFDPLVWPAFIGFFELKQQGKLYVYDYGKGEPNG